MVTDPERSRVELLQRTLDMLILRTLQWGAQHGHGIGQAIRASPRELLQIETGSLYPALHHLERQGGISSEWKTSGKKQLVSERTKWKRLVKAIQRS